MDVRIEVDGQPLTECPDPDNADDSRQNNTRYVEAKTGQIFSVVMKLESGFRTQNASHLNATCELDQSTDRWIITKDFKRDATIVRRRLRGQLTDSFTRASYKDPESGGWFFQHLTFGALVLIE